METFQALPLYYCTECVLYGEDFSLQRKARVFLILHRQPFLFDDIAAVQLPRLGYRLADYLEQDEPLASIPGYVYTRLDGGYRDLPKIYDPQQEQPVNLFTNYRRDRSLFLVKDATRPAWAFDHSRYASVPISMVFHASIALSDRLVSPMTW